MDTSLRGFVFVIAAAVATMFISLPALAAEEADGRAEKLLNERFSAAGQPLPQRVRTPAPRVPTAAAADVLAPHIAPLGAAPLNPATLLLPQETPAALRAYPAYDLPPPAAEADPLRPAAVQLPVTARAHVWTPDAHAVPPLERLAGPLVERATIGDDPFAAAARDVLLAGRVTSPIASPLQLEARIADPFEHVRAVRLARPPADDDPPAARLQREPPVQLPVDDDPSDSP